MSGPPGPGGEDRRAAGRSVAVAAAALLAAALGLSAAGVGPFRTWSYQAAWYPLLLLLDGAHAWRTGRFLLAGRPRFALSLFLWSAPVWFVFEALNLRLANWFYVNVPAAAGVRWGGYVLAFATVLPAVYLPDRWLARWLGDADLTGASVPVGRTGRWVCGAAGVLFLALPLWRPDWFYPLVWGATALLLEPWNHLRDPEESLLGDLERGRWGRIVRLLLAGLAAGLLWESMNAVAGTRWIYTVPGLETGKLFEMPLPGFIGFTVFGLECRVMYRALVNAGVAVPGWGRSERRGEPGNRAPGSGRLRPVRTAAAALLAAAFCAAVSAAMDRRTVASYRPSPEPSAGADAAPPEPPGELARLRGLGARNAELLSRAGIAGVCDLAGADDARVARLLGPTQRVRPAARERRVRVWIRAARAACATEPGRR